MQTGFYQWVVESSSDAIFCIGLEGNIISFNKSAEKLYRMTSKEVLGRNFQEFIFTQERKETLTALFKGIISGTPLPPTETIRLHANGDVSNILASASPIYDTDEKIIGISAIIKDLTEIKNYEKLLEEKSSQLIDAQRFYEDFYENAPDMFISCDIGMNKIYKCNYSFSSLLGYTNKEILTLTKAHLFHEDCSEKLEECLNSFMETGRLQNKKFLLKKKKGGYIPVSLNMTATYDSKDNITGIRAAFRDISDLEETRKLAEQHKAKLEQANSDLLKSNEELESFAYLASHDLKSPLRVIGFLTQLAKQEIDEGQLIKAPEYLTRVTASVNKLGNLLDDMLNYFRVCYQKSNIENVNTHQLVHEVIDLLGKPEGCSFEISSSLPILKTAKIPLQQIFQNIINNSILHHHNIKQGKIIIKSEDKGDYINFSITDNGPGINKNYHEKIFQMFQTLPSSNINLSTGMGLAVVKKVIEKQGGQIKVKSGESKGTCFEFSWYKNSPIYK